MVLADESLSLAAADQSNPLTLDPFNVYCFATFDYDRNSSTKTNHYHYGHTIVQAGFRTLYSSHP